MSWTYSGDPSASPLDAVRFAIGDTETTYQLLQNEEINYLIAQKSSINDAAYAACMNIVAKLSRLADQTVGPVSTKHSQMVEHYRQLADKLWANAGNVVIPYAGGTSISDNQSMQANTNFVQPAFSKGFMDNG
jgi:hypothetical protein